MNVFPKGARVCFVGDSITHNNGYLKHLVTWYRTNLPEHKVEFYNCGISGGGIGGAINVFEEDTAIYDPTHVVLMIGSNDSRIGLLKNPASPNRYALQCEAFERYKKLLAEFHEKVRNIGAELILCNIPPYDEYQDSPKTLHPGGFALYQGYCIFIKEYAQEHGLQFCDVFGPMVKQMHAETLYETDRMHPNERGHLVLAKAFLAFQGVDYTEPEAFPAEVEEWGKMVQKYRGIIQAECLTGGIFPGQPDAERIALIEKRRQNLIDRVEDPGEVLRAHFIGVMERYLEDKAHQAEYLAYLKNFMKNR